MNKLNGLFFENKIKVYFTLLLIPFCLYIKSLWYNFSPMDDQWLILENTKVLSDWRNFPLLFKTSISGIYYRPLLNLSFMMDYHVGQKSPLIYHFTNLILHLLTVILFYHFLIQVNVSKKLSFLFALVFSVHPAILHTVAWIPGRNDLLLAIFTLCSFIFLINYLLNQKQQHLFFHLFFFSCSLLTKENALILPIFFGILSLNYKKSKNNIFVFILSWLTIIVAWYLIRKNIVNYYPSVGNDLTLSIKNFISGFLLFTGKCLFPIQQSVFPTLKNASVIPGFITIILIIIAYIKLEINNKVLAALGLIIFTGVLAIPVWYGATSSTGEHYEHRIYLPLIGLLLFITQLKFNINSKLFNYIITIIIVLFSIKTFYRMNTYKNEMTYIDSGIKETPEYYLFHFKKGDKLFENHDFINALAAYNTALKMQPFRVQIYNNRANVYCAIGKKDEAINDYNTALKLSPNNPNAYLNRCVAYKNFGDIENAMNDLTFLKQNYPNFIPTGMEDEYNKIWDNYQYSQLNKYILLEPKNAILLVNRAKFLLNKRMGKEALADLKKACELEPNNIDFKNYFNELNSSLPH